MASAVRKPVRKNETAAARALLKELRKSFLDDPYPDPEKEEMARDQVVEEPTTVHALLRMVDEDDELTIDQRSVIAGFGVDVLVNHGTEDKPLFDAAIALVIDFLLRVAANPKLIEPKSRVHVHAADALGVINGDLDAADTYRGSMKKTLKALRDFQAQAEEDDE